MDSEAKAEVAASEALEQRGTAPPDEERMEKLLREVEPLARAVARRWAQDRALRRAVRQAHCTAQDSATDELLQRYQPLVRKVASQWARPWPAQREDIAQEISVTLWHVLRRRPDAPLNYLMAVANKAAHKYLSRGVSVDRPLSLKRRQRWEVVTLELLLADEEGDELVAEDKVRRHQAADEWASVVEDLVVARLLYLDIYGHLSRLERKVLRARILGYRNADIALLLGLTYAQVKNARRRIAKKARWLWDAHVLVAPETAREQPSREPVAVPLRRR